MPATPYKNITWTVGSDMNIDRLNIMANNDQWLFENMPKAVYNSAGVKRAAGIKIMAGTTPYPVSITDWVSIDVSFGSFFSAGSTPVVVATVSTGHSNRKFVTLQGLNGYEQIDHRGFKAIVSNYEWLFDGGIDRKITRLGLVNWIAMGY